MWLELAKQWVLRAFFTDAGCDERVVLRRAATGSESEDRSADLLICLALRGFFEFCFRFANAMGRSVSEDRQQHKR